MRQERLGEMCHPPQTPVDFKNGNCPGFCANSVPRPARIHRNGHSIITAYPRLNEYTHSFHRRIQRSSRTHFVHIGASSICLNGLRLAPALGITTVYPFRQTAAEADAAGLTEAELALHKVERRH
jgi:hypothetical protein